MVEQMYWLLLWPQSATLSISIMSCMHMVVATLQASLPFMCITLHVFLIQRVKGAVCRMQSNPDVQDWMRANSLGSLSQLETYFEGRVLDLATLAGRSYIVWQVPPSHHFRSTPLITGTVCLCVRVCPCLCECACACKSTCLASICS